jgi:hypothetical protein
MSNDLKNYTNLQQIALKDEIYVDDNGLLGTEYPLGTYQFPVMTLAQARVISGIRNIVAIRLRGSHNIDAAMERYNFKGYQHLDIADLISFNGQDVDGSSFWDLVLTGAQGGTGYIYGYNCVLINATGLRGVFNHCKLITAIALATGGVDNLDFNDCYSLMGNVTVTVNSPDLVNFYNWKGAMTLATMTGGIVNIWAGNGATITINATCTGGTINIYGNCRVIDNSAGTVVTHHYLDFAIEEVDDIVSGMLVQVPFFVTMDTIVNNTITLFNFDAVGATIREVHVSFYLPLHATATFTPTWEKTRVGAPVTYTVEAIPAISTIITPAAAQYYRYHCGEIAQGLQGRFRIAQNNNAPVVSIDAFAVVVMEL